jgi:hypothetical protein
MGQACHRGGPALILGWSVWYLWWTKWHWDRFFSEYFGFPLSFSFHPCNVRLHGKTEKTNLHHRVAQEASRLRSLQSIFCGVFHNKKNLLIYGLFNDAVISSNLAEKFYDPERAVSRNI